MKSYPKMYDLEGTATTLNRLSHDINGWAIGKGFWEVPVGITGEDSAKIIRMKKVEKIALIGSEAVGELLEAVRKNPNSPSEHIPHFTAEEEEVADTIIQLLDYAGAYQLRVGEALVAKMAFNEGRPYQHGKAF